MARITGEGGNCLPPGRRSLDELHAPELNYPGKPWEDPSLRDDVTRTFNLRISEKMYYKIRELARHRDESMQTVALEHLEAGVKMEVSKMLRTRARREAAQRRREVAATAKQGQQAGRGRSKEG
ncbi:hypothetical protein [Acidihalobacter aeolianus]|nr:hypothetical protein [Acidihalobacter aeolianus]